MAGHRNISLLREKMGPDILTYVEHQNDVAMAYSGGAYLDCDYLRKTQSEVRQQWAKTTVAAMPKDNSSPGL